MLSISFLILTVSASIVAFCVGFVAGTRKGKDAIDELDAMNLPARNAKGQFVSRKSLTTEQLRRELAEAV